MTAMQMPDYWSCADAGIRDRSQMATFRQDILEVFGALAIVP